MFETITNILYAVMDTRVSLVYALIFAATIFETLIGVGMFIPGSVAVLIAGALAAQGYLHISVLFAGTILAAIAGDNLNYWLGRQYGVKWVLRSFWFVGKHHIDAGKRFLDKHGAKSIFLGRFVPSVKEILPFFAGIVRMDFAPFLFWNIMGAVGWSIAWLGSGYVFAQSLHHVYKIITHAEKVILVVFLIGVFLYIVYLIILHHHKLFPSQEKPLPIFEYKKPRWVRLFGDSYVRVVRKGDGVDGQTKKLFEDL